MLLNVDWKFRDDIKVGKADTIPIEILTDVYGDVVYRYTVVKVQENPEKGEAKMIYDYEIINPGRHTTGGLKKDKRFQKHIGLILNQLLLIMMDKDAGVEEEYYEDPSV